MADYVEVLRTIDPLRADLAEAALRASGIVFVRRGTAHAAGLGAGPQIVEQIFEVRHDDVAHARELVQAEEQAALQAVPEAEEEPASDYRSPFKVLVRKSILVGLLVLAALLYSIILIPVARFAAAGGVSSFNLVELRNIPALALVTAAAVGLFAPDEYRSRCCVGALAGLMLLALFGTVR